MPPKSVKSGSSKEKVVSKFSFFEPYAVTWPPLDRGVNALVLNELKRFFLGNPQLQKQKSAGKRKRTENTGSSEKDRDFLNIRRHVFVGVNVVTKHLEKGELDLVLTCSSAKPRFITHHIISLCATRGVPAGCVNGLSGFVSRELNFKSALALGFRSVSGITGLIRTIAPKLTELEVPWLLGNSNDKDIKKSNADNANRELSLRVEPQTNEAAKLVPVRICVNQSVANKKIKRAK